MRVANAIELTSEQRRDLKRMANSATISVRLARRARIVLLAADGLENVAIARTLGVGRSQVACWRNRFAEGGINAIRADRPRSGRRRRVDAAEILRLTTDAVPVGRKSWTTRSLAAAAGVSDSTVWNVWHANGVALLSGQKTHVEEPLALLDRIEGLYLNPPDHALALCCNGPELERSLERVLASLAPRAGHGKTLRDADQREGGLDLAAALDASGGANVRHTTGQRQLDWFNFLRRLDRSTPNDDELHVICDNRDAHGHPQVTNWLAGHPRFHIHVVPAIAPGINLIERFVRCLDVERKLGSFLRLPELIGAIDAFVGTQIAERRPFAWTAHVNGVSHGKPRAHRR
jgi:transposase